MINESWFRSWAIALTAGMLLGAFVSNKELKYLPLVLPVVVVSFFYPVIDKKAEDVGRKTAEWLANRDRR